MFIEKVQTTSNSSTVVGRQNGFSVSVSQCENCNWGAVPLPLVFFNNSVILNISDNVNKYTDE